MKQSKKNQVRAKGNIYYARKDRPSGYPAHQTTVLKELPQGQMDSKHAGKSQDRAAPALLCLRQKVHCLRHK